jgi:AcrR family transcriptional regulator
VRREALVDATLRCLKQFGHKGVSVRRISAAAGVSIGLINHHFPSKSSLIAETYETLALSLQDSIRRQADDKAKSPRQRLSDFFRASFAPEILDPQLFNVWLVFWSMVAHSPEIRAVHDKTYGKYRSILESLLRQLVATGAAPPLKLRPAAISLCALLDGLWVELSLSPTTFKPREAIALCEDWVNALCSGGFVRLLGAAAPKRPKASRRQPKAPPKRLQQSLRLDGR